MKNPYVRGQAKLLAARLREPRRFLQVLAGPRQGGKTTLVRQVLEPRGPAPTWPMPGGRRLRALLLARAEPRGRLRREVGQEDRRRRGQDRQEARRPSGDGGVPRGVP